MNPIEISPTNMDEFSSVKYKDLVVKESKSNISESEEDDFEQTRKNIKEILEKGQDVLDGAIELAKISDSPRAYEVTATLIKTLVETNKDLLDIHKKKKELTGKSPEQQPTGTTNVQNNTVFVGSGIELLELLKKNK